MTKTGPARQFKVLRLRILKPVDGMTWAELGDLLRAVRYRVFRLANLMISETYLAFHRAKMGESSDSKRPKASQLNLRLREMLEHQERQAGARRGAQRPSQSIPHGRFAERGAVHSRVLGALEQYKIRPLLTGSKLTQILRGETSLPVMRADIAIPVRCDEPDAPRLERTDEGAVELSLRICCKPYPRVLLDTAKLEGSPKEILNRLLDNREQRPEGYLQRYFEIKYSEFPGSKGGWYLLVAYNFPVRQMPRQRSDVAVGVDLGVACPIYAALSNGHARLGWKHFSPLAARVRSLQHQTIARRRNMLRGGRSDLAEQTARSGHGRKRRLRPIEKLRERINQAYRTLNHQLSAAVVQFARDHGAGVIQMENLEGLKDVLQGTYLGARWRYHELQTYIAYKAQEHGIEVRKVNPAYTSQRCSACGYIHVDFTRAYRDRASREGFVARFECPQCQFKADPDYNAARNLALLDIETRIRQQCAVQGVPYSAAESDL